MNLTLYALCPILTHGHPPPPFTTIHSILAYLTDLRNPEAS